MQGLKPPSFFPTKNLDAAGEVPLPGAPGWTVDTLDSCCLFAEDILEHHIVRWDHGYPQRLWAFDKGGTHLDAEGFYWRHGNIGKAVLVTLFTPSGDFAGISYDFGVSVSRARGIPGRRPLWVPPVPEIRLFPDEDSPLEESQGSSILHPPTP